MAKLLDFRKNGDRYAFRWTAEGDAFYETLEALKAAIPLAQRTFDPETKFWTVRATEVNEGVLASLFDNGKGCVETVKAQLSLW